MNRSRPVTTIALTGLAIMISVACAAPKESHGEQGLRDRLAGAWRSTQFGDVLNIDGDLCVTILGSQQTIFTMQYKGDVARRTLASTGVAMPEEVTLRDGKLIIRVPALDMEVTYVRLDTVPDSLRLDPFTLGTRSLNAGQVAALRREIAQRFKTDQDVRTKFVGAGRERNDPTNLQAMIAVDKENTLRIIDLLQDVGWLDAARFGGETQMGAFMIVQHSGNLRLMRTVLPLIEGAAKADRALGQLYALLYDRLQLSLGKKQRYGTQVVTGPNGKMTVARLEDRARVDERRRKIGMEPLADYIKTLGDMHGTKITIGD